MSVFNETSKCQQDSTNAYIKRKEKDAKRENRKKNRYYAIREV